MPVMRFSPAPGTHFTVLIAVSARKRRVSSGSFRGHITVPTAPPSAALRSAFASDEPPIGLSMAMNHCGVLRNRSGALERQECGYWCLSRPRATSAPASTSFLITASFAPASLPLSS
jgi:hypothetical protein